MKKYKNIDENDTKLPLENGINTKPFNWFPGHMVKTAKKIKENIKLVDIVLEIRDARSPLVTGNRSATFQMKGKSRLIILNKSDLADPKIVKLWEDWFKKQGEPFIFIDSFDKKSIKQIIQISKKIVQTKRQESNPGIAPKTKLKIMIIGLPNTGKSTIINKLANRNATKVADKPAQTQHLLWVTADKDLDILDTPGVMPPEIETREHGLWLSALNAVPDRVISEETTACYILEHIAKTNPSALEKRYKINNFEVDIIGLLNQIAETRVCFRKNKVYDYEKVYKIILNDFRAGDLGLVSFGLPPQEQDNL